MKADVYRFEPKRKSVSSGQYFTPGALQDIPENRGQSYARPSEDWSIVGDLGSPDAELAMAQDTGYVSQRELDARLEAVDGRGDQRSARIEAAIAGVASDLRILTNSSASMQAELRQVKEGQANVRWYILSSAITLGLAMAALIIAMFAYGAQMFELAKGLVELGKVP